MTFSLVALDPVSGDLGVAVASKFLAVGSGVPWADASVGAVATQAWANVDYGPEGLALLRHGLAPAEVVQRLVGPDPDRSERQVGIVDRHGRAAAHTGAECMSWAGHRVGAGVAIQGNILAGPQVVDAMLDAWLASADRAGQSLPLAERLLAALAAGDAAGGDRRGRQSAALLVVRAGGGYGGRGDRWLDLRVDDHPDPVPELLRLRELHHLYWDRPSADDLVAIDHALAEELVRLLDHVTSSASSASAALDAGVDIDDGTAGRPGIGTPRSAPTIWTNARNEQLTRWMAIENLEERAAASGWIDPAVLQHLRASSHGA